MSRHQSHGKKHPQPRIFTNAPQRPPAGSSSQRHPSLHQPTNPPQSPRPRKRHRRPLPRKGLPTRPPRNPPPRSLRPPTGRDRLVHRTQQRRCHPNPQPHLPLAIRRHHRAPRADQSPPNPHLARLPPLPRPPPPPPKLDLDRPYLWGAIPALSRTGASRRPPTAPASRRACPGPRPESGQGRRVRRQRVDRASADVDAVASGPEPEFVRAAGGDEGC